MAMDETPTGAGSGDDDEREAGAAPGEPSAPSTEDVIDEDDDALPIDRFDRDADKATDTSADDAP
jgi:hypothetical protein